jgi:hypothetical protein
VVQNSPLNDPLQPYGGDPKTNTRQKKGIFFRLLGGDAPPKNHTAHGWSMMRDAERLLGQDCESEGQIFINKVRSLLFMVFKNCLKRV